MSARNFIKIAAALWLMSQATLAHAQGGAFQRGLPVNSKGHSVPQFFNSNTIGAINIGTKGSTGIYSGYTLVGGDDFQSPQNIVGVQSPLARYFTTKIYSTGARSVGVTGALRYSYDMDSQFTGSLDSNRGVAVGTTDTVNWQSGALSLKSRAATGGELPYINGRTIVSGMIHTGGYVTVTPPCIVEARIKFTAANQNGWHPTFWVESSSPLQPPTSVTGAIEADFEGYSTGLNASFVPHGVITGGPGSTTTTVASENGTPSLNVYDGNYHLFSFVMSATQCLYYIDGTLVRTVTCNMAQFSEPYQILFTNHTYNAAFGTNPGDTGVTPANWTSTGSSMTVDYYRIWTPTAAPQVIAPLEQLPVLLVNYNTSMTYTLPSVASIWGSGVSTDYVQGIKKEDFEPGTGAAGTWGTSEGNGDYVQFPAGLTWNSGTRVLTGITSDLQPGRIHIVDTPYVSGGSLDYCARGYIDVGPTVTTPAAYTATTGTATTYDLYPYTPCGTLIPKTVTVTGLPTGFSFSNTTGLITGQSASTSAPTITVAVSNSSGQTASTTATFNVVAAASNALLFDAAAPNSNSSFTASLTTSHTQQLIIAFALVAVSANTPSVLTITDKQGLYWRKRAAVTFDSGLYDLEEWYAVCNALVTSDTVTAATNGVFASTRLTVFAIRGLNESTYFDTNSSFPATATTASAQSLVTASLNTNHANDCIIQCVRSINALSTVTAPSGFTSIVSMGGDQSGYYDIVAAQYASQSLTWSWTGTGSPTGEIVDAIQGN